MKCTHLLFFFVLLGYQLKAQNKQFVYVQTENKQNFLVKVGQETFSSSDPGYVVIPLLAQTQQTLIISFPESNCPPQKLNLFVNDKDKGYLLKNFDLKGWGLFDLQTMEILFASDSSADSKDYVIKTNEDGFSNMLADVTNTPSIKQTKVALAILPIALTKEVSDLISANNTDVKAIDSVASVPFEIKQLFSFLDTAGRSMTYLSKEVDQNDTIILFIPYNRIITENEISPIEKKDTLVSQNMETNEFAKEKSIETVREGVVVSGNTNGAVVKNETLLEGALLATKKGCTKVASDDDFMQLRRKMANQTAEENMTKLAEKSFKNKCFSTAQIRNLSVLYLKEENKYHFFELAFPHITDMETFPSLQSSFTEEKYKVLFQQLVN